MQRKAESAERDELERREAQRRDALARGEKVAPLIDKEQPTSLQLQEWLGYAHQIRFNDLTRLPEMDGNAITNSI